MEAVILIGLQAAGKTTFCRERFWQSHIRLSMDMLRTRFREDLLLKACLEAKQPFVIDNTNPTEEERARYIHAARECRFRVVGYYFESRIEECKARNAARSGKEAVPEVGLLGTYNRMQLPKPAEGFDELSYVRMTTSGPFEVLEWQDEV